MGIIAGTADIDVGDSKNAQGNCFGWIAVLVCPNQTIKSVFNGGYQYVRKHGTAYLESFAYFEEKDRESDTE